jgi:hypothetical protein
MRREKAARGWCADEYIEVDMCIMLDQLGDGSAIKGDG